MQSTSETRACFANLETVRYGISITMPRNTPTVTPHRPQCFTVTVTEALFPSLVAVMIAVPSLLPFTVAL
jgi:hypothetical protein